MRNALIGGLLGTLLACGVLLACGGGGGGNAGAPIVVGESMLAAAHIRGDATTPVVTRFVNRMAPAVTVSRVLGGWYVVNFGFDVSDRFYSVSPGTQAAGFTMASDRVLTCWPAFDPHELNVTMLAFDGPPTWVDSGSFYITVH